MSASTPGVGREDLGRGGGRGDTEHHPALRPQLLHRGAQRGGLAGAGRADHQDQFPVAGHRSGDLELGAGQLPSHSPTCSPGRFPIG